MVRGEVREFYSGRMNEADVFGRFRPTPEFAAAFRAKAKENGYVGYEAALDLVRQYGQQDPLNPDKPFANELRQAVIEALELETEQEMDRVRFYSAIGTPADKWHGIDGWIEYQTPQGRKIIVTVDVTQNPNKDVWKADVIIPGVTNPSENEDRFIKEAEQYGKEVVSHIEERLEQLAA